MRRTVNGGTVSRFAGQPSRPIIIGGCPRSGTTLLRTMLHSHPELAIPRETRFVIEAWDRRRMFGDLRLVENRRRLAAWIFERDESLHRRLGIRRMGAVERLVAAPPTLGSLLAECFVLYAKKHGKPRWGDKRPKYATRLAVVWDLFPSAQFVHVVRDPRSCAASMRRLGWFDGSIVSAVELWERSLATVNAWRERLAPDQVVDLRYEDLVTDAAATLARVAAFGRLAADEEALAQTLRYHERKEVHSDRYHRMAFQAPDPRRISGWRDELDRSEVAFVEAATRPLMEQYGYEVAAEGVPPARDLVRALARSRRRTAAARLKLQLKNGIISVVTHRRPVAATQAGGAELVATAGGRK